MALGALVFQTLLSFNKFLYQWASHSSLINTQGLKYHKLPNNRNRKNYDLVLQEFVLIKTQYKVLTSVLKKKSPKLEGEFLVKVLE